MSFTLNHVHLKTRDPKQTAQFQRVQGKEGAELMQFIGLTPRSSAE